MNKNYAVISVQKTGGFAGLSFNFEQKLAQLQEDQRARLDSLIAASGLRDSVSTINKSKNARDVFSYSFVLREGDATYTAVLDDTTMTSAYRALLQYVQDLNHAH